MYLIMILACVTCLVAGFMLKAFIDWRPGKSTTDVVVERAEGAVKHFADQWQGSAEPESAAAALAVARFAGKSNRAAKNALVEAGIDRAAVDAVAKKIL